MGNHLLAIAALHGEVSGQVVMQLSAASWILRAGSPRGESRLPAKSRGWEAKQELSSKKRPESGESLESRLSKLWATILTILTEWPEHVRIPTSALALSGSQR